MNDQKTSTVGFGNLPVANRFKKSRSGNPKGRPKKKENIYTLLYRVLKRKVLFKGAEKKIPISEAFIRRLREFALSGDKRALDLQRRIMDEAGANEAETCDLEERKMKILKAFEGVGVNMM